MTSLLAQLASANSLVQKSEEACFEETYFIKREKRNEQNSIFHIVAI